MLGFACSENYVCNIISAAVLSLFDIKSVFGRGGFYSDNIRCRLPLFLQPGPANHVSMTQQKWPRRAV